MDINIENLTQNDRQLFYDYGYYYGANACVLLSFEKEAVSIWKLLKKGDEAEHFFGLGYKDGTNFGIKVLIPKGKELNKIIKTAGSDVKDFMNNLDSKIKIG